MSYNEQLSTVTDASNIVIGDIEDNIECVLVEAFHLHEFSFLYLLTSQCRKDPLILPRSGIMEHNL